MKMLESEPDLMHAPRPAALPRRPEPRLEPEAARRSPVGLLLLAAIVLAAGLVIGIVPRLRATGALKEQTDALSIPTVNFIEPRAKKQDNAFVLPGEVRPFVEAPIYARTNGYLKRWYVDIGAEVKAGDLLAEIDTPDLDQQLANAKAQAAQAEASAELAKTTAVRYNKLRKTATISDQDADERNSDSDVKAASSEAARASVRRYEDLQNFQKVVAPFDGTITQRNTDVGQLVDSSGAHSLFQLTQSHTLRLFVRAPESEVSSITVGQKAKVSFPEFPGRQFEAKVVRTAGAIDLTSRTLLTELELDNVKGEVLPGSHAEVQFAIAEDKPILMLPSNALLFRSEGPQAGVVDQSGNVHLRSLGLGRDFGRELEILSGISEGEHIILNPADSLMDGAVVRAVPAKVAQPAAAEKPPAPGA